MYDVHAFLTFGNLKPTWFDVSFESINQSTNQICLIK